VEATLGKPLWTPECHRAGLRPLSVNDLIDTLEIIVDIMELGTFTVKFADDTKGVQR
jgi:hypothetical protein